MDALKRLLGLGGVKGNPTSALSPPSPRPAGSTLRAQPLSTGAPVLMGHGWDLEVVGESFHQEVLWELAARVSDVAGSVRVSVRATLEPDPTNQYDPNAVVVRIDGAQVGHLSRDDAALLQHGIAAQGQRLGRPVAVEGVIVGSRGRSLGVFLSFDPADFGAERDDYPRSISGQGPGVQSYGPTTKVNPAGTIRTGLSEAVVTDEQDDSYDLSWLTTLPGDTFAAIARLRKLLQSDPDPIDRHYMYAELEARLYRGRDAIPLALDEYDRVCAAHDAEMDGMRPVLLAKFGALPLLDTYRQATVRHEKAKDWAEALRWSQRGLDVYGDDAARAEWVDWLREKVVRCSAKLSQPTKPERPERTTREARPEQPVTEILLCEACGREWDRQRTRGRKPRLCPSCSATASG